MQKLDPDAFAAWGDIRDYRGGVQAVSPNMIADWIHDEDLLPEYSAKPFVGWLYFKAWHQFDDGDEDCALTNRDVIMSAITDWCGGRTR